MRHWWILYLLFFPLLHCAGNTGLLDSDYATVDGRIAFVGPGDFTSFKIFVMRPDGDGLMRLTSEKGGYTNPSWSPNARRVVFASNRDALGNFAIYIFDLEDMGIQKVVDLPGPDLGAGERIAFQALSISRDCKIWACTRFIAFQSCFKGIISTFWSGFWVRLPRMPADGSRIADSNANAGGLVRLGGEQFRRSLRAAIWVFDDDKCGQISVEEVIEGRGVEDSVEIIQGF